MAERGKWGAKRQAKAEIVEACHIDTQTHWHQLPIGICSACAGEAWLYAPVTGPETKLCGTCATHVVSESVPERKAS